jgi:hypothetical protein
MRVPHAQTDGAQDRCIFVIADTHDLASICIPDKDAAKAVLNGIEATEAIVFILPRAWECTPIWWEGVLMPHGMPIVGRVEEGRF